MTERIRFHFDPICPWCYQTSRWVLRLAELGEVELSWGLFSLELVNAEGGDLDDEGRRIKQHARSGPSLRTCVLVRDDHGDAGLGRFYAALGRRVHQLGQPVDAADTIAGALAEAELDPGLAARARDDDRAWDRVADEHRTLVEGTRSFGVPTMVLDGGDGPAIFGPVISQVPTDEDAVQLLRSVAWLARYDNFSELKRDRTIDPDLESIRRYRAATDVPAV